MNLVFGDESLSKQVTVLVYSVILLVCSYELNNLCSFSIFYSNLFLSWSIMFECFKWTISLSVQLLFLWRMPINSSHGNCSYRMSILLSMSMFKHVWDPLPFELRVSNTERERVDSLQDVSKTEYSFLILDFAICLKWILTKLFLSIIFFQY